MSGDQIILFGILALLFALLIWGRWRYDLEQIAVDVNRHGRSHRPRESAHLYKLDRIHRIDRTPKVGSIIPDPV